MADESRDIPEEIGEYRVLTRIGAGGMAELFAGRTRGRGGYEKVVAIKRILPQMVSDETSVQMFFDEARISARLIHANIAQIYDLGVSNGAPFIALEYVHGVSLNVIMARFSRQERLASPSLSAYVVEKICAALDHAHSRRDDQGSPLGIVHRDVNPANVLCSFDGEVKLIDFGIAKAARRLQHTRTGYLKGKLAYMSPEQVRGLPVDHRSDIFAAGTLLYVLLTGVNPFRADSDVGTLERVRAAAPPPPRSIVSLIPPALEDVCVRAMSLDVEDRFEDAGQMEHVLHDYRLKNPFDRRRLAGWMRENLREEMDRSAQILRQAEQGTSTDHKSGEVALEEDQDETCIFAQYTPPADVYTETVQTPAPEQQAFETQPPRAPSSAVSDPMATAPETTSSARGGRRWSLILPLALGAVILAAVVAHLASPGPTPHAVDQADRTGREQPPRPVRAPTGGQPGPAADAGAATLDQTTVAVEPLVTADAGLDRGRDQAEAAVTRVRVRKRRRRPRRHKRRRRRRCRFGLAGSHDCCD